MELELKHAAAEHRKAWDDLWRGYLTFYETERPQSQYDATWQRIIDGAEGMHSIIAFGDGAPVGLANFLYHRHFWDSADRCYLSDLFVVPAARGAGIAGKLIGAVAKHAELHPSSGVYWTTAVDNRAARRLYDRVAQLTPFIKYAMP